MFEIRAATEMLDLEAAIFPQQNALEHALILRPQQALQGSSAAVAVSANFQQLGLRLSKPHHGETQRAAFDFRVEHAAHGITVFRPQVQNALAFARDGIFRCAEVEQDLTFLDGDSLGRWPETAPAFWRGDRRRWRKAAFGPDWTA